MVSPVDATGCLLHGLGRRNRSHHQSGRAKSVANVLGLAPGTSRICPLHRRCGKSRCVGRFLDGAHCHRAGQYAKAARRLPLPMPRPTQQLRFLGTDLAPTRAIGRRRAHENREGATASGAAPSTGEIAALLPGGTAIHLPPPPHDHRHRRAHERPVTLPVGHLPGVMTTQAHCRRSSRAQHASCPGGSAC